MSSGFEGAQPGSLVCLPKGRREPFPRLSAECQRAAVPVRGVANMDHAVVTDFYALAALCAAVAALTPFHMSSSLPSLASDPLDV